MMELMKHSFDEDTEDVKEEGRRSCWEGLEWSC